MDNITITHHTKGETWNSIMKAAAPKKTTAPAPSLYFLFTQVTNTFSSVFILQHGLHSLQLIHFIPSINLKKDITLPQEIQQYVQCIMLKDNINKREGADAVVFRTFLCEGVTAFIRESLGSPLNDENHKYDHIGIEEKFLFQL